MRMYPALTRFVEDVLQETDEIPTERRAQLRRLSAYIGALRAAGRAAKLNFICTHNSRRSHISQIWATTAAAYYELNHVRCFSGGTEATAFNPRAVAAMARTGFRIENPGGTNPRYRVTFAESAPPIICFSKTFDDPANPTSDFAAVMTCSDADANCPFIPGATRFSLTYVDPKIADETPEEEALYDERVRQIGRELFFALAQV